MESLDFLYSLMSPFLYKEAQNNIKHLEYYFATNPNTSGSPLVHDLVEAIKTYDYNAIGEPLFRSILQKTGKTTAESKMILDTINKWRSYPENQMDASKKFLMDVVAKVEIDQTLQRYKDSPADAYKAIKDSSLNTSANESFKSFKFGDMNIQKVLADKSKGAFHTNYQWLNDVFPPHNGIEASQLGIICAPPGVGKSLFAMNLALYFASCGVKVLYVTLGDLIERDWIVRLGAIYTADTFANVYNNMENVFYNLKKVTGDNLEISINPSGKITSSEIVDYAMERDYQIIFVDYDANHAGVSDGTESNSTSMYSSLGQVYADYTRLTMNGRLVFLMAQPKQVYWNGLIGLDGIGESKRKQETADFIITLSRTAPDCPNPIFTAFVPKARRGRVGTKKYLIRIEANFYEIPRGVYEQLAQIKEEVRYTPQDIERMVMEYNKQQSGINQKVKQMMNGGGAKPGPNPFAQP